MHAALGLSRLIDGVTTVIGKSVIWLIFAAILISAINAVTRKLWSLSSNSWLEAQWYLFGAAFMLGAAYTLKENEHIRIDIFYGSRSRRTQHWIDHGARVSDIVQSIFKRMGVFPPKPKVKRERPGRKAKTATHNRKVAAKTARVEAKKVRAAQRKAAKKAAAPAEKA